LAADETVFGATRPLIATVPAIGVGLAAAGNALRAGAVAERRAATGLELLQRATGALKAIAAAIGVGAALSGWKA
jgi:hypothetical protein